MQVPGIKLRPSASALPVEPLDGPTCLFLFFQRFTYVCGVVCMFVCSHVGVGVRMHLCDGLRPMSSVILHLTHEAEPPGVGAV